ncbi:dTDP-4-dehydrorhamnose reductase [Lederbergia galactosidilyticus]|uniref:dTDP-4-dehydrorhamnose reductase n=1 Tax=Lederbergia galactosidilytica TaxID=217031 RepID=UPI001AE57290|nr:dTDP-4-dehydrorhamnose reductase [Lederbergia galactosidilytica]MBP1915460.1 dTDP-4-dehydrorhamnose reductase [Lederbergia galactosidilytica]
MKILVTGFTGQLGYDVVNEGKRASFDMYGVGSKDLDITVQNEVNNYIEDLNPDAIIHCAAYTSVDKAENEREICWNVNVEGTKNLAEAAKRVGAKFLYVSTDYVFDGEGETSFKETDQTNPINYYGLTKYEGEKIVQETLDSFIVRISWVFGLNGKNFIKTMLRLADSNKEISVVGDQVGSPTYTYDLAKLIIEMIQTRNYGIYHATNEGFCSWAEFAEEIFRQSNKEVTVNVITTEDFPTSAVRPKNSRLSKSKLDENGFSRLPKWQEALSHYLNELKYEVK